ncbi:MAG: 23S rRNA (pseudouridine(1915)-N(3))-methyltransferase RlmH [Bryobacterales bacterium]|nr:23S rRNA (pseudouridine(1915)-N(3))-methyltransferase RlmH [Bryobacterales bacterium]
MKVYLYYVGKPRDDHANRMAADYVERSSRFARCEMREIRPERADPWTRHPNALTILLDPSGKPLSSPEFTAVVERAEMEGRDLVFVVGGADGLPAGWKERAGRLLSLSALTFPHELARVILAEQIYRAFTTLRGHPYPR